MYKKLNMKTIFFGFYQSTRLFAFSCEDEPFQSEGRIITYNQSDFPTRDTFVNCGKPVHLRLDTLYTFPVFLYYMHELWTMFMFVVSTYVITKNDTKKGDV